jgi:hypothetical protein
MNLDRMVWKEVPTEKMVAILERGKAGVNH